MSERKGKGNHQKKILDGQVNSAQFHIYIIINHQAFHVKLNHDACHI
jgi:hypothetical protein